MVLLVWVVEVYFRAEGWFYLLLLQMAPEIATSVHNYVFLLIKANILRCFVS